MHLKLILAFTVALACQVSWAAKLRATTCNCGWTNKGRIVGGSETQKYEFPWTVAMYNTWTNSQHCGASIITANHALTAGHCVERQYPSSFVLLVGVHNVKDPRDGTRVPIEKFVLHPYYSRRAPTSDDIAVIVTRSAIPLGPNAGPVCLPSGRIELDNKKIKAIGWGQEGFTMPGSPVLKSVDLTVVSYETCRSYWELTVPKSQICTVDNGKSTCHVSIRGDSGGPLVMLDPEIQRYTLVALTSFGKQCVTPPPAVNTEVAVYMTWIQQVIQANKPAQICMKI